MEGVGKWISACEEEKWLEDYTQVYYVSYIYQHVLS